MIVVDVDVGDVDDDVVVERKRIVLFG